MFPAPSPPCPATKSPAGSWPSAPEVEHHRVGERCLVQTDYRTLVTRGANAAFGYTFEGGLQEYVLLDERVVIEPGTGERYLIPVPESLSASAIALVEPWSCVENAYASADRRHDLGRRPAARGRRRRPRSGGPDARPSTSEGEPGVGGGGHRRRRPAPDAGLERPRPSRVPTTCARLPDESFDDIVYFGASARRSRCSTTSWRPRA